MNIWIVIIEAIQMQLLNPKYKNTININLYYCLLHVISEYIMFSST